MGRCSSAKFWLLKRCHGQRFASDNKRFGRDTKTLKKDNQHCRITAYSLQKCKECLCGIYIGSDWQRFGSGLIAIINRGQAVMREITLVKKMQIYSIIYSFS